jgi:hypothetical protein
MRGRHDRSQRLVWMLGRDLRLFEDVGMRPEDATTGVNDLCGC